jgi:hypothetical protein
MKAILLLVCLLGASPLAIGADAESDGQAWVQLISQGPGTSKLRGYMEVQPRWGGDFTRLSQLLLRPAVFYAFDQRFSLWAGYAWASDFIPSYSPEQRTWEQFQANLAVGSGTLISRSRLEQRYRHNQSVVGHRIRQLLRYNLPLGGDDWWAVAWDEVMFNFNTMGRAAKSGYDQNRAFLGVNHKLSPLFRVEAGYIFVHVERFAPADRFLHIMYLGLIQWF